LPNEHELWSLVATTTDDVVAFNVDDDEGMGWRWLVDDYDAMRCHTRLECGERGSK
jgi:hypothetical protein